MYGANKASRATTDRSWFSLALFVLVIWCMAMAQLRSDALPETVPLYDTGFSIIPEMAYLTWSTTTYWATIADIWCFVTYIVFGILVVPFCCNSPWAAKTRFTFCMTSVFVARTCVLLSTRYPRLVGINNIYITPNTALGAVLVILGIRTTQTDFMFSGHTSGWIMMAMFFWHYRKQSSVGYTLGAILFWLSNIVGMILLIGVRTHYTNDVAVAIVISSLTFVCYHLVVGGAKETYVYRIVKWLDGGK